MTYRTVLYTSQYKFRHEEYVTFFKNADRANVCSLSIISYLAHPPYGRNI